MALTTFTYTLITGGAAASGTMVDPERTTMNTVYYRHSGLSAASVSRFILEARDPVGNWGYTIDSVDLTGVGTLTSIATFNTPITNGIRGNIQSVMSGCSGYMYLDCSTSS